MKRVIQQVKIAAVMDDFGWRGIGQGFKREVLLVEEERDGLLVGKNWREFLQISQNTIVVIKNLFSFPHMLYPKLAFSKLARLMRQRPLTLLR